MSKIKVLIVAPIHFIMLDGSFLTKLRSAKMNPIKDNKGIETVSKTDGAGTNSFTPILDGISFSNKIKPIIEINEKTKDNLE